jgi:imidazolonepropionase
MVMSIASLPELLPAEALNAATINAAHSIGLGDRVGSIEVGKVADLVIINSNDYRLATYEFGGNLVRNVIKTGRMSL